MYLINFIASAVGKIYEEMIPPYIFFALSNNKNACVEVIVEDSDRFTKTYEKELAVIRSLRGDHFIIRNFSRPLTYHMVNTYRFFEVPTIKAKYTYICDIDIMLLESIVDKYLHTWPSSASGHLPYNNMVRRGKEKLTGVHFVITDKYYTNELKRNQELLYNSPFMIDEDILYNLCAMTFGLPDLDYAYRPILGIHFSPNRGNGKIMDLVTSFKYHDLFLKATQKNSSIFKYPIFSRLIKSLNTDFKIGSRTFYSALFTDKDKPSDKIQDFERLPDWEYILFTNLDIVSDSWTVRKIDLPNKDYVISAKMIKWLTNEYLPEFDIVCWIDAYCQINSEYKNLLDSSVKKLKAAAVPLFIKAHPVRHCIYDEVNACIAHRKVSLQMYNKVKGFLKDHDMPHEYGLYETNLMLKYNNHPKVIKLSKEVMHHIYTLTYRDQLVLTYVLFKNNIKALENIDPKITLCDTKDTNHKYVNADQRRVAICFWGIMRSLKFTLPSIKKYIFKPLDDAKIPYDVFLHTFNLNGDCTTTYSTECTLAIDKNEYKLLNPKESIIENQKTIDEKINFNKYMTMGNPWQKAPIETAYNHIRALWSLKQVTSIWLKHRSNYSHVMYCRPDMTYIMPIKPEWFSFSDSIYTPAFARHGRKIEKLCDRFAIGMPEQMEIYGNRFSEALEYSKKSQLHSETFASHILHKNGISRKYVPFGFLRTRANSQINTSEDVKEAIRRKWFTKRRYKKVQNQYTRKMLRNIIND